MPTNDILRNGVRSERLTLLCATVCGNATCLLCVLCCKTLGPCQKMNDYLMKINNIVLWLDCESVTFSFESISAFCWFFLNPANIVIFCVLWWHFMSNSKHEPNQIAQCDKFHVNSGMIIVLCQFFVFSVFHIVVAIECHICPQNSSNRDMESTELWFVWTMPLQLRICEQCPSIDLVQKMKQEDQLH